MAYHELGYEGIIFFLIFILVGISLVSIHYRKKYEESKKVIEFLSDVSLLNENESI